jgi:predicted anti-sigma-YlaC factor YlaD
MKLSLEMLKKMVRSIAATHSEEIDCETCFEQVDRFAELTLQGKDVADAMPLVQDHLDRCGACREEFEALLDCLRATAV